MSVNKQKPGTSKKKPPVSNKVTLDANNPIPFEYGSFHFSYINQSSYLPFLPSKDDFAQNLLEARLLSPTHNACITTKRDYCAGEGIYDINGAELPPEMLEWFGSMNLRNEDVNELNKKLFEDFFTWGNVPVEIVKLTVGGVKKIFIYVHDLMEWRLGTPDENDIVQYAIQSKLFTKKSIIIKQEDIEKAKQLPIYNPNKSEKENWKTDENGTMRTLLWYRHSVTGFPYYGLPSSVAGMICFILEYKGLRYNLDNFENNMVAGAILALKGQLGQGEANRIGKDIIKTYTGDGKRGRTVVVASEEGIEKSDYHKLDVKTDGSYNEADDKWTQKIILVNEWDSVLAGLVSPSTLGKGSGFLTKIQEYKLNTVIRPAQKDLVNKIWKHVLKIAAEWMGWKIDQFEFGIKNSIDISGLTDVDITPAVQVNEVREAKGLKKDPKMEGVYMKLPAPEKPGENDDEEKKKEKNPKPKKKEGDDV